MALNKDEIEALDERARHVGEAIGRDLRFVVAPNPEFVGITSQNIFVLGPDRLADMAAHDVDLTLDALIRGDRRIIDDEDGDPRLL